MKIIDKKETINDMENTNLYILDSLKSSEELIQLFNLLLKNKYILNNYWISYVHDHTRESNIFEGYGMVQLEKVLSVTSIEEIENMEFISNYMGIETYGKVFPKSNSLQITIPQKRHCK